jgi:hypothetical protein
MIGWIRHRFRRAAPLFGAALLIALLAANQVAANLHDADHPFHGHQSLCDAFLGAGLQTPATAAAPAMALPASPGTPPNAFRPWVPQARNFSPLQPRAPPAILPTT